MVRSLLLGVSIFLTIPHAYAAASSSSQKPPMSFTQAMLQTEAYGLKLCRSEGLDCSLSIYDSYGSPLALIRANHSLPLCASLAMAKAHTSAVFDVSTPEFQAFSRKGKPYFGLMELNSYKFREFVGIPGGTPFTSPAGHVYGVGVCSSEKNVIFTSVAATQEDQGIANKMAIFFKQSLSHYQSSVDFKTWGVNQSGKASQDSKLLLDAFSSTVSYCHSQKLHCILSVVSKDGLSVALIRQPGSLLHGSEWGLLKAWLAAKQSDNSLFQTPNEAGSKRINLPQSEGAGFSAVAIRSEIKPVLLHSDTDERVMKHFVAYLDKRAMLKPEKACLSEGVHVNG